MSIYLSICLSVYPSICLSAICKLENEAIVRDFPQLLNLITSKTQQFSETSSIFEVSNIKNEAVLRDFLNFWSWQHQKRSSSARLPQFLKLVTSKTKQFCETSFNNGKLNAELTASYQCVLQFFHSICLNYCACHAKVMPGHTKCCTCHIQSCSRNWRSDAPKCTPLRKSVPGPPNISDERVSCTAPATENASLTILFTWPTPATFDKVHNLLRRPRKTTSESPKVLRTCQFLTLLISKYASRHNAVHFFDISTSKSAPTLLCFVHFDLDTRFAPQQRALFRHHNFQKCSDPAVFCTFWLGHALCATTPCTFRHHNFQKYSKPGVLYTFWLGNVLRATTVCNFSSLIWPHGSAPAALVSRLFDPPEPQITGKTQCLAALLPFPTPVSSFFSLFLFSDLLSSALLFSDSSHLCFSICPYCRKFDFSKLLLMKHKFHPYI